MLGILTVSLPARLSKSIRPPPSGAATDGAAVGVHGQGHRWMDASLLWDKAQVCNCWVLGSYGCRTFGFVKDPSLFNNTCSSCPLGRDSSPGDWTWDLDPFLLQILTEGGTLCQVWC